MTKRNQRCFFFSKAMLLFVIAVFVNGACAATIFSDDFNGSLDPAWNVLPGQGSYQVSAGALFYYNDGFASSPGGWNTTSLRLAVPFSGLDWELDAEASYNLYYLDQSGFSSGAQRPQLIVSFDSLSPYTDFLDFERGVDAYYSDNHFNAYYIDGANQYGGANILNPAAATIVNNVAGGTYWLRAVRHSGLITLSVSYDGNAYTEEFTAPLSDPLNPDSQLILSGTTWETVGSFTRLEFVRIEAVDTPEPATVLLFGAGLGACVLGRRGIRRRKANRAAVNRVG